MHRFFARLVPVITVVLVMSSCGGDEDTPTGPAPPTEIVESFPSDGPGVLTLNGAFSYPFTVTTPSSIQAQLVTLKPADESFPIESVVPVGLALGTWNGSICQVVLANDVTKQGDVVVANASAAGDYCVRIYDASGKMPRPQAHQILVSHF